LEDASCRCGSSRIEGMEEEEEEEEENIEGSEGTAERAIVGRLSRHCLLVGPTKAEVVVVGDTKMSAESSTIHADPAFIIRERRFF
jgi:hypothetical protein